MKTRSEYSVKGMNCGHCVQAVQSEISGLPGVVAVAVNLDTGVVTVDSERPLDLEAVRSAIDEAGFDLVEA